jgi:hypothetical protein
MGTGTPFLVKTEHYIYTNQFMITTNISHSLSCPFSCSHCHKVHGSVYSLLYLLLSCVSHCIYIYIIQIWSSSIMPILLINMCAIIFYLSNFYLQFIYFWFNDTHRQMQGWTQNKEFGRPRRKAVVSWGTIPRRLELVGKITKHLSHVTWYPIQDLGPGLPEYEAQMLPTPPRHSVLHFNFLTPIIPTWRLCELLRWEWL